MVFKNIVIEFKPRIALLGVVLLMAGCGKSEFKNVKLPAASPDSETSVLSADGAIVSRPSADSSVGLAPLSPAPTASSKTKREPIYTEESNGKELIAAALKKAQRDHKHVLVEWGGNWCGWCYKLHDVFHKDSDVQPIIQEEFVLVLIDSGANKDLMLEYGGQDRQYSFPHLTVLDEKGNVLTNQETGSLEEGPNHDPKLVTAFLRKWMPEKVDAEKSIADACAKAASENKRVLVRVGDPYCGWCTVLAQFVQDHDAMFANDFVDLKIDTLRMLNAESTLARFEPKKYGGRPWMVILDASGKEIASSLGPSGNIGYPFQPEEIKHFVAMLRETRQRMTDNDLVKIEVDLNAYREASEKKTHSR